jgi:hypothetical protein
MLLGLDHLVVAVADPEAAAAELERTVGLVCTGGGHHPSWGTYNRLAWLGDTYVELIGVADRSLAPSGAVSSAVLSALDEGRPGLVSYALAADDLDAFVAALRASGSPLSDVETRSRTRPDGEVVRWRATFPGTLGPARPPFVIEHEYAGAEWGDEARRARAGLVHRFGSAARVTGIDLPVADLAATSDAYRSSIGVGFEPVPGTDGAYEARVGEQRVRIVAGTAGLDPAIIRIEPTEIGVRPRDVESLGVRWSIGSGGPR